MYEIAKASSHTAFTGVQSAACFAKVGDGGQLAVDGARGVPARVECVAGFLRRVFVFEARINVADQI